MCCMWCGGVCVLYVVVVCVCVLYVGVVCVCVVYGGVCVCVKSLVYMDKILLRLFIH